jgi:hypothetical protein
VSKLSRNLGRTRHSIESTLCLDRREGMTCQKVSLCIGSTSITANRRFVKSHDFRGGLRKTAVSFEGVKQFQKFFTMQNTLL